ncbi:hypothetical protein [Streptomyces sp. NPDC016172]|jgi:hypothetical protein|uniref:hypothetical protein n=1 Tax=Streptomyces TaxID=1883 RepID=UPI0037015FCE
MTALVILLGVGALLLIVVGTVLFCWGAIRDSYSAGPHEEDQTPIGALIDLLTRSFKIAFSKKYAAPKRLMAQGLILISVGALVGIGAIGAAAAAAA